MKRILVLIFFLFVSSAAWGEAGPLAKLGDATLSYFMPVTGTVTKVEGKDVFMTFGEKGSLRPGMRLKVLREGESFVHPVTKEALGKVESIVGKVELKQIAADPVIGSAVEGSIKEGDKVLISDVKVRVFFCQDKGMDWYLADEYYRVLKNSGRVEMIDTALESGNESEVLAEARKSAAEVVLMLSARQSGKETLIRERLFWVSDGSKFIESEAAVDQDYAKELKVGGEFFTPQAGEAVLKFELPFGAKLLATGDVDGDGKQEIILATGNYIRVYRPGADLQLLGEIKISGEDLHMETVDLNKNGKEEIIVTVKKDSGVVSSIYGLEGPDFKKILEGNYFLRSAGGVLFMQGYSNSAGFSGDVYRAVWDGGLKRGEKIILPAGVNIFDFALIEGSEKETLVFAYDDAGFLNLYNGKGLRVWRSAADTGGFLRQYKRESGSMFREAGQWSVKDRLFQRQRQVLAVQRTPIVNMAKSIGYKSSAIKDYWWNGFSMEESTLIDGIRGTLLDYSLTNDEVFVLASPIMGLKFGNILKGESPLGATIYIYTIKGSL